VECPVTFLYTSELIAANQMQLVGRPKLAKTLPRALPAGSVAALLAKLSTDPQPRRRSDWVEPDRALILTALLAGLRADELLRANVGDLRRSDEGAAMHVRGKGGKDFRCQSLCAALAWRSDTPAARIHERRDKTARQAKAPPLLHSELVRSLAARGNTAKSNMAGYR
jgi:site-specific recombinase XerD